MVNGAFIPARLTSERLPRKALAEVCGRPMIHHLMDRVAAAGVDKRAIVVCTADEPENEDLIAAVTGYGARVFTGELNDIVKRLHDANQEFGFDRILLVLGDNPLTDADYIRHCLRTLEDDGSVDVAVCQGLPIGVNPMAFTSRALETIFSAYATPENDTGFPHYFTHSGLLSVKTIGPESAVHVHERARMTLDYEEDLRFFERVFEALYREGSVFGIGDVVRFLTDNPNVVEINAGISDEYMERWRVKARLSFIDGDGQRHDLAV